MATPMTDDPLSALGAAFTPQDLLLARLAAERQGLDAANSPYNSGLQAVAKSAGLALGSALGQMGGGPLDRLAAHNQTILAAPPADVGPSPPGGGLGPQNPAPTPSGVPTAPVAPVDPYQAQAADYSAKARAFLAAGNVAAATQFSQAALAVQQTGAKVAQQAALTAQEQGKAEQEQAKTADMKARSQFVIVTAEPDANGIPVYKRVGNSVNMYGPDGTRDPAFGSNIQQALADAQKNGATSATVMTAGDFENSKANVAATAARARLEAAQLRASGAGSSVFAGDQDALDQATGMFALRGPMALTRMAPADRAAVMKNLTTHGLTYQDAAEAALQYGALTHAVNTGAARAGRVMFLSSEIPGQAQNVADALDGVDRTRLQAVNSLIAGGKAQFSDPGEARYATAIQGLLTPYSLLIAGATGQSSDAARSDAYSILTKSQGKDAVKAVLDQIVNRELVVAKSAGDATIEMARNSRRYSALAKVASKMGVPLDSSAGGDQGDTSGALQAPGIPAPAPGAPGAGSSSPVRVTSPGQASSLPSGTVFVTPDGRQMVKR